MNLIRDGKKNLKVEDFAAKGFLNFAIQSIPDTTQSNTLGPLEMTRRPSQLTTFTNMTRNNSMSSHQKLESSTLSRLLTQKSIENQLINQIGQKENDEASIDNDACFGYTKDPTKFCYPRRIIENRELGPTEVITVVKKLKAQDTITDNVSGSPPQIYNPKEDAYLKSSNFNIADAQTKLTKLSVEEKYIIKTIKELKDIELRKLAKEFITNQIFNARHKNHINKIVRAMFGEEKYEMEFNKLLILITKKRVE